MSRFSPKSHLPSPFCRIKWRSQVSGIGTHLSLEASIQQIPLLLWSKFAAHLNPALASGVPFKLVPSSLGQAPVSPFMYAHEHCVPFWHNKIFLAHLAHSPSCPWISHPFSGNDICKSRSGLLQDCHYSRLLLADRASKYTLTHSLNPCLSPFPISLPPWWDLGPHRINTVLACSVLQQTWRGFRDSAAGALCEPVLAGPHLPRGSFASLDRGWTATRCLQKLTGINSFSPSACLFIWNSWIHFLKFSHLVLGCLFFPARWSFWWNLPGDLFICCCFFGKKVGAVCPLSSCIIQICPLNEPWQGAWV